MAKLKEKAFWIAAGDIAGRGLSFITSIYLARTLGTEFFGLITVSIAILGYATWVSDLGLNNIGTRETAKKASKRTFHVLEVFRMKLLLGLIVLIASILIVSSIDTGEVEKQVIIGYLFSIIPYVALMEWFYAGKQQFGKIAASKVLNGLVYFLLVYFLVDTMEDVTLVPILYTAGIAVAALTLGTFAIKDKPFSLPSRGTQIYPDLLKTSSILGLGQFFAQIVILLPPILIGSVFSLNDAGLYGAAFRIVIIAMMIDRIFVNLLLPNLSSIWSKDRSEAHEKVDLVYRMIAAGGALVALFIAISSKQVIGLLYGPEYHESILLLQILSVMIAATFINSLFSFGLIATNKDREYFMATCFGGTLAAVIMFGFASVGNSMIVAISVSLSEIIITLFTCFWFRKVIPINYFKPLIISYPLAIFLFIISLFSPLMPIINALIACIIFVSMLMWIGILTQEQFEWVKEKILG